MNTWPLTVFYEKVYLGNLLTIFCSGQLADGKNREKSQTSGQSAHSYWNDLRLLCEISFFLSLVSPVFLFWPQMNLHISSDFLFATAYYSGFYCLHLLWCALWSFPLGILLTTENWCFKHQSGILISGVVINIWKYEYHCDIDKPMQNKTVSHLYFTSLRYKGHKML